MSSDNALRTPVSIDNAGAQGHVESHFLKANSADGTRALWIKFTSLLPRQVAELWAIAFDGAAIVARKRTYPLAALQSGEPFHLALPDGTLTDTTTQGDLDDLRWQLRYTSGETFRPFPLAWMYRGPFPRSKSLTPSPDARVNGWFEVAGERWVVERWRGCQGHNWGASHAHHYAWVHSNVLAETPDGPPLEGAWVEALTGRVRLGPTVLPFMTVAGVQLEGQLHRFAGPRALFRSETALDTRSLQLVVRRGGDRLQIALRSEHFAGLRYQDPDGQELACLNSKLAHGRIAVQLGGRERVFYTRQAALEIGTREPGHGVELLA